jgi:hypothetical protein
VKIPDADELAGMTVNERFFACGLLDTYDAAKARGDAVEIRRLLELVYVDEPSILRIIGRSTDK